MLKSKPKRRVSSHHIQRTSSRGRAEVRDVADGDRAPVGRRRCLPGSERRRKRSRHAMQHRRVYVGRCSYAPHSRQRAPSPSPLLPLFAHALGVWSRPARRDPRAEGTERGQPELEMNYLHCEMLLLVPRYGHIGIDTALYRGEVGRESRPGVPRVPPRMGVGG